MNTVSITGVRQVSFVERPVPKSKDDFVVRADLALHLDPARSIARRVARETEVEARSLRDRDFAIDL